MEFCPKCGKVMIRKKKSSNVVLVCPKCGYEKKTEEVIITALPRKRKETEVITIEEEEEKLLPTTTDVVCPKCGNREAYWWTIQTRSADEPATQFFRCTKCNHTWREYA